MHAAMFSVCCLRWKSYPPSPQIKKNHRSCLTSCKQCLHVYSCPLRRGDGEKGLTHTLLWPKPLPSSPSLGKIGRDLIPISINQLMRYSLNKIQGKQGCFHLSFWGRTDRYLFVAIPPELYKRIPCICYPSYDQLHQCLDVSKSIYTV